MVDEEVTHWAFAGFQLQAELLLQCGEDGRANGSGVVCRGDDSPLLGCEFQGEVVGSGEAGLIDDMATDPIAEEVLGEG